ncbi:MAG: FeoA family protein [Myxococcota bacterium]
MEQTLGQLPVGARGVVARVDCERPVARRLMEMGLLPGTPVEVVRVAPLGDPIEIRVRGYALSLRRRDAVQVVVGGVEAAREAPTAVREEVA